jgi:DNA-binding GntR family transcriptional regulator
MTINHSTDAHFLPMRRALADDVYDALLVLLMDQVIGPGSRASIDGLARRLDVSPTPVREALARLESEGLVIKRALRGYTASPLLDSEGLRQLFEMRALLEPAAARLAARGLTPRALDELDAVVQAMQESGKAAERGDNHFQDYRKLAEQDADFHRIIAEHSGNDLLAEAIVRLRSHLHLYRLFFKHGITEDTAGEHEAVLEAFRAGDPNRAEEAMATHISHSYQRYQRILDQTAKNPA